MSNSINAKNLILGGAQRLIPLGWNTTKKVANGIYGTAQWAWSHLPDRLTTPVAGGWNNMHPQHKTAVKTAAALAAGVAAASVAPLGVVGSAIAGVTATATTAIAENPNHVIHIPLPEGRPLIELTTPGEIPAVAANPAGALRELERQSIAFKDNHPAGKSAERLETITEDPQKVENLKNRQSRTEEQKQRLVANVSAFATAYFIFENRLGLNLTSHEGINVIMEMTQAAVEPGYDGEKPSLWDACITTLERRGIELSFFQKIRARFWYLLADIIGIIPNACQVIADTLLTQLRGGTEGQKPTIAVSKILQMASSFLDKYNGAAQSYADANRAGFLPLEGNLAHYQKKIIDELGDTGSLAKAILEKNQHPEEELGKLVMQELCKEFVAAIVDDPNLFPSIPFFRELQKITFLGIRFGIFFDWMEWILGGIINWIAKKLLKAYAPDFVSSLVNKGLEQTMPGNYSFKIAIARSLKEYIDTVVNDLKKGIPARRIRFEENDQLNEMIHKLIRTLKLEACQGDQQALRKKLKELENLSPEAEEMQKLLKTTTIKGFQLLIHHYTQNQEAIEELFRKLFELSSDPFQAGATIYTEADYNAAVEGLKESVNTLIKNQVEEGVRDEVIGEKWEYNETVLYGKRIELEEIDPVTGAKIKLFERVQGVEERKGELDRRDKAGNFLYPNPEARDAQGRLTHLLDETGKPVYKGLFNEQKEKTFEAAKVLKGLSLKMRKEIHTDTNTTLLSEIVPGENPADENQYAQALTTAEERLTAAQEAMTDAETFFSTVNAAEPLDAIQLITAKNQLNAARIELNIATEELRIKKEIAKLDAQRIVVEAEAESQARQNKLAALAEQKQFANEELLLVKSMEEFNGLKSSNDHLLKNLDNYMKVVGDLSEYMKSLNVNLYSETIQKLFYRTFGPIYEDLVPLTKQAIILQELEKSYDKSKRLAKEVTDIKSKIAQNPINLFDILQEKVRSLRYIDNDFGQYEADPVNNVEKFATMTTALGQIEAEQKEINTILASFQQLGSFDQLMTALLNYPKATINKIETIIPAEDLPRLAAAISGLQEKTKMNPTPDFTAEREAIQLELQAIGKKYTDKKRDKALERRAKLQEIKDWAQERKTASEQNRDAKREQLSTKFGTFKQDTDALAQKMEKAELPPVHYPVHHTVKGISKADNVLNGIATPYVEEINKLTDSAYKFMTDSKVSEAIVRLGLGRFIEKHRHPAPSGLLARMIG